MLRRTPALFVLSLVACGTQPTPVKLLEAAKRGASTDPFWEGGKARSELFNVMSWEVLEPGSSAALEALRLRQEAANLRAAGEAVATDAHIFDPILSAGMRDAAGDLTKRAGELEAKAAEAKGDGSVFRARIRSTTKGGQEIVATWLIPVNAAGLVTDIVSEADATAKADLGEVARIKAATVAEVEDRTKTSRSQRDAAGRGRQLEAEIASLQAGIDADDETYQEKLRVRLMRLSEADRLRIEGNLSDAMMRQLVAADEAWARYAEAHMAAESVGKERLERLKAELAGLGTGGPGTVGP